MHEKFKEAHTKLPKVWHGGPCPPSRSSDYSFSSLLTWPVQQQPTSLCSSLTLSQFKLLIVPRNNPKHPPLSISQMSICFTAAAAAAASAWGVTLFHTFYGTPKIQAPLWNSSSTLKEKAIHYLCWHGMSAFMAASAIVNTLPLIYPQTAILHRSAIIMSSSIYAFCAILGFAESMYVKEPKLLAVQYIGLDLTSLLGFISAYYIKA